MPVPGKKAYGEQNTRFHITLKQEHGEQAETPTNVDGYLVPINPSRHLELWSKEASLRRFCIVL